MQSPERWRFPAPEHCLPRAFRHPPAPHSSQWLFARPGNNHFRVLAAPVLCADASAHLNILYGYGEYVNAYWAARHNSAFSRINALGLKLVGPQAPNGPLAEPWPDELPKNSLNVPTYHTNRQFPETATRQLDFVFASAGFADVITTKVNEPSGLLLQRDICYFILN